MIHTKRATIISGQFVISNSTNLHKCYLHIVTPDQQTVVRCVLIAVPHSLECVVVNQNEFCDSALRLRQGLSYSADFTATSCIF